MATGFAARVREGMGRYRNVMRYDVHPADFANVDAGDEAGLSFAAFSLEHAACGDDVLEVRLGEEALLEWCMACSVMMIFRTDEK